MIRAFRTATLPSLCAIALAGCSFNNADDAAREAAIAAQSLQAGAPGQAHRHILAAIEIRDDISDYWVLRAQIATAQGNAQEAFESYRTVIALDRANADALRALCQLGNRFARPDELDRFADQLAVLDPRDTLPIVAHGYAALMRGNTTAAKGFVDQALAINVADGNALVLQSQLFRRDRKFIEAAASIRKAAATFGPSPSLYEALIEIHEQARDRAGYEGALRELVGIAPNNGGAAIDLADLQYQNGDRDGARATIATVVKKFPDNVDLAGRLLDLWLRQAGALPPEEITSDSAEASLLMQAAYAQYANETGQPDLAIKIVGRVRGSGVTTPTLDAHAALAEALALKGDGNAAQQIINAILAVDPTHPRALIAQSRLDWASGARAKAVSDIRQVVTQDAANATARILLARYLDGTGEQVLAVSALREGIAANPHSTRLTEALYRMLMARNKREEAAGVLNDVAIAAPLDLRAGRMRTALCPATGSKSCLGPVKFIEL